MTSPLQTPPSRVTDAGLDFNYAAWTPGTKIQLANVPWNDDYRDIVYFPTNAALDTYLAAQSGPDYEFTTTYHKLNQPVRVSMPFNQVIEWNYLRAFNPVQPGGGDKSRTFYYFIKDVRYIAPDTTEIIVQLDVWQTFNKNVSFGNCYVERGHVGVANSQNFDDNGRTWLTIPEGHDIGSEYVVTESWEYDLINLRDASTANDFGVIVASTTEILADSGTVDNPKLQSAMGSRFESLPNGCALYYFDAPLQFENFQTWISPKPWVSQGIISVTVVPRLPNLGASLPAAWDMGQGSTFTVYRLSGNVPFLPDVEIALATNFRNSMGLPSRYAGLKKFQTYPYSVVEVGTYSGNPLVLKPECINRSDIRLRQLTHIAPPSPRIAFVPLGYNAPKGNTVATDGEWLSMQTGIFDLPTFSVVNNGYMAYMAANRNAIAYQHSSADWSQQRAMAGAATSYGQAVMGVNRDIGATGIQQKAMADQAQRANSTAAWRMAQGIANSGARGLSGGGPAGVAMGGLNDVAGYAIGVNDNNAATAIAMQANRSQLQNNTHYALGMADTNRAYAEFAAKGDYANNIAGINAKVQDAKLIQPTTSGQIGGDAFNLATYKWSVYARLKTLQAAAMRNIGEYWLRYGYAVNTFSDVPSDFQCMSNFTYWKLHETYITGQCSETVKQTIRGIFEKGVTVWNDPAKIGQIDIADNTPRAGVTL